MRIIGQSRAGDVWLACDASGTFRAVKVVYRTQHDTEESFGWEQFDIANFEPLSLAHDGFLDILQTGQNESADCLFHVTELADDDTGASFNGPGAGSLTPEAYDPRSLQNELERRGPLPISDCLRAAATLAGALAHAHGQGLLCPITKRTDVLFVNGTVKTSVIPRRPDSPNIRSASAGFAAQQFGTRGGDVQCLAMVIYQMASGNDVRQYPAWPDRPDIPRSLWGDLKNVISRAAQNRYATAEELRADLETLQSGRRVSHGGPKLALIGAVTAALVIGGGILFWMNQQDVDPASPQPQTNPQQARQPETPPAQPPPSQRDSVEASGAGGQKSALDNVAITDAMRRFLALSAYSGKVLFADALEADSGTRWRINKSGDDTSAVFGYDFNRMGIPAVPGSRRTKGLQLAANMSNPAGRESICVSPADLTLAGNYRLKFNLWMNSNGPFPDGGPGSTQFFLTGIGTDGAHAHWQTANITQDDGIWFAVNGDGDVGSGSDYYAFEAGHLCLANEAGVYAAGTGTSSRDNRNPYYTRLFPGGQTPPPRQAQRYPGIQIGGLLPGSIGMGWHAFEIVKIDSCVVWRIDGAIIAAVDADGTRLSTNVFVGYADCIPSVAKSPELCFALVSDLVVEAIGPIPSSN